MPPSTAPAPSLRTLRQRRDRARDLMSYAGWTAMAVGLWDGVLAVTWLLQGNVGASTLLGMATTGAILGVFGWRLTEGGLEWDAIVVLVAYLVDAFGPVLLARDFSGIVWKVVLAGFFVRGLMATVDYHELAEQVAAHPEAALEQAVVEWKPPAPPAT